MKSGFALLTWATFSALSCTADPTWPAAVDEIEDVMYLAYGHRARGFMDRVTPCSRSPAGQTRNSAGEWLRTAFHDMATADVAAGTGGLDGSIVLEIGRAENKGAAFRTTALYLAPFYNPRASISDLLAVATYGGVRSCGGPQIAVRHGRKDATVAGETGEPDVSDTVPVYIDKFSKMGFNQSEMIAIVACGHTLSGVHAAFFPEIVPWNSQPLQVGLFDDPSLADTIFDNAIARDYVLGNTTNPLVVGPSVQNGMNADGRIFASDGNVTITALADADTFRETCRVLFEKMLNTVPAGVELTVPIKPYTVKPSNLQLTLLPGGATIQFSGEIRIKTTNLSAEQIASVKLTYKDRNGRHACNDRGGSRPIGGCIIDTVVAGTAFGFDDAFTFYSFSTVLSSAASISSFDVVITTTRGRTEVFDNNRVSYPVQDNVIYQFSNSCLDTTITENKQQNMTVVAAVRTSLASSIVNLDLGEKIARAVGISVPELRFRSLPMEAFEDAGPYTLFRTSLFVGSALSAHNSFDVSVGTGKAKIVDAFKMAKAMNSQCVNFGGFEESSDSTLASTATQSSKLSPTSSLASSASTTVTESSALSPTSSVLSTISPTSTTVSLLTAAITSTKATSSTSIKPSSSTKKHPGKSTKKQQPTNERLSSKTKKTTRTKKVASTTKKAMSSKAASSPKRHTTTSMKKPHGGTQ